MAGFAKPNTKIGFGQVEPNHLSGIVEGKIYAQYPADTATMGNILEQGRFAKYDGSKNQVNLTGKGAWMMIYNEEKLPDERKQNHKDFALKAEDYTYGEITPRLINVEIGDIFTTNTIVGGAYTVSDINALTDSKVEALVVPAIGSIMYIAENGYLTADSDAKATDSPEFEVIKPFAPVTMPKSQPSDPDVYTGNLPDMQYAVKLMRIK